MAGLRRKQPLADFDTLLERHAGSSGFPATTNLPAVSSSLARAPQASSADVQDASARRSEIPAPLSDKLGMFEGVFVPTTLNVLSILMFLRFGFIVGQAGFTGSMLLLLASYAINLLTILSISAIATNGVVRGGGAYYMISRSLGPEFGGSIGVVFYIGQVLNAGLNVVGFVEPMLSNFGQKSGAIAKVLPESREWEFTYETVLLWFCTVICLTGPSMFARSSKVLFVVLVIATVAIPLSTLFVKPYFDEHFGAWYTGPSIDTLMENFWPHFTKGAAGSDSHRKVNFQDLFGIFFPATAGIFAGASMSGDLRNPSKSIPKGTLYSTLLTFILYAAVIVSIAMTVSRDLLHKDAEIIRNSNLSPMLVILGEFSTSLFSSLMGIIGAAKLLQAISRDDILPFIGMFRHGTGKDDNPIAAVLFTYVLTQLTIFLDINKIAVYITMAFLMTFVVTNIACFLLDVSSAPNFRPSFRYFNATTAACGTAASVAAMFAADAFSATLSFMVTTSLFIIIHFYSPPKPWGDVSQTLIYHQVRKYLLRLRQDHVKYWRPQILLLVDDPRSSWSLIKFCSHLKKGGLFVLGHVIVARDFNEAFPEIEKQRSAWTKLRDTCGIKAFVQVSASVDLIWGVRNVVLGSGLGGMKPNIAVMGFYDETEPDIQQPLEFRGINMEALPTDNCRKETHMSIPEWVNIVEDLLTMKINLAIARGFLDLELPMTTGFHESGLSSSKGYIDLYPIQMSARLIDSEGNNSGLSINFDTYTLILQLGAILHTVPAWKNAHNLRVIAFVEFRDEVTREEKLVRELLEKLRIPAEVLVVPLEDNLAYNVISRGAEDKEDTVGKTLKNSRWWKRVCDARKNPQPSRPNQSTAVNILTRGRSNTFIVPDGISLKRRERITSLQQLGVAQSMQSTRIPTNLAQLSEDESWSDSEYEGSYRDHPDEEQPHSSDRREVFEEVNQTLTDVSLNPSTTDDVEGPKVYPGLNSPQAVPSTPALEAQTFDGSDIAFNEMPAKPQHLILNSMMRNISKDSVVLFSTLPAPVLGTHKDKEASLKYHDLLDTFCGGLPPIILIHAQSLTVTTAL